MISDDTNWDRGLLNYEIEKAVDYYKLPIIIAYTGISNITNPEALEKKWPKALNERIKNRTAKCVHIAFNREMINMAIAKYDINNKPISALQKF